MNFEFVFAMLLFAIPPAKQQFDFYSKDNTYLMRHRLQHICRKYYEEGNLRIAACNDMRFMYEVSPHYEMGYLIGEIIERYRKMVELTSWMHQYEADTVFMSLVRIEMVQKLYFEVYHLVHMIHEIERKYKHMPEFQDLTTTMDFDDMAYWSKIRESDYKWREKQRREKAKRLRKIRAMLSNHKMFTYGGKPQRNTLFPINYGWEIHMTDWLKSHEIPKSI